MGKMAMKNSYSFWETVISGLIATFIMTMISFLLGGFGLPIIDVGYILQEIFNHIHQQTLYSIIWGNAAYYFGGILLSLIWVAFLDKKVPGHWLLQGIFYGIFITILAAVIISPIVSMAGGEPFGIFYTDTWYPILTTISGFLMHLGYGISLLMCLNYAHVFRVNTSH